MQLYFNFHKLSCFGFGTGTCGVVAIGPKKAAGFGLTKTQPKYDTYYTSTVASDKQQS